MKYKEGEKLLYVIKWIAKRTGVTGYSTGKFTWDQARKIADSLNDAKALCVHTVVPYTKKLKDKLQ